MSSDPEVTESAAAAAMPDKAQSMLTLFTRACQLPQDLPEVYESANQSPSMAESYILK